MKVTIVNIDNWGYNNYIKSELEKKGVTVTFIDLDKHQYKYPTFYHKSFNFISKLLFSYNLKRQHLYKILTTKLKKVEKQDTILVIKGDFLCAKSLKLLKSKTKKLIAYFNDCFERYPRMKNIYPFFDTVYSFEPNDVKKYNFHLITNYIYFNLNIKKDTHIIKYQVFNISSLDKRGQIIPKIASYLKKNAIKYRLIVFSEKPFPELEKLAIEVTDTTFSQEEVFELTQNSEVILDFQRPKQEGLSFRIFEALGLEKKIITTNKSIKNYDFYNPKNIVIINEESIEIPADFFTSPYVKIAPEIILKYHISSWVNQVFSLD